MSDSQLITSRPWDNLASYTDAEWWEIYRDVFDGWAERGPLFQFADGLEVTESSPAAMSVDIGEGAGIIYGLFFRNVASQTLDVAANATGATRYDLVFAHWTRATQVVNLRIVDGTGTDCSLAVPPAANAIGTYQAAGPPATEWGIPLACIAVPNGATSIVNANITDLREFSRFRLEANDLADGISIDTNAAHFLEIANNGVGVDEIDSSIAGDALTGGSGSALDVVPDGTTLELNADALRIAAGAAGDGLGGGGGAALSVNVDGTTIQIAADTLQVGSNSLDHTHIANRPRVIWIGAGDMQLAAASAAVWGRLGVGYPVCSEGWLFPAAANNYVVFHLKIPGIHTSGILPPLTIVWGHDNAGGAAVARWHMVYNNSGGSPWTYHCGDGITSTLQGTVDVDVLAADQALRQCDDTVEYLYYLDGVTYLDFQVGRNGLHPNDNYAANILLLGCEIDYTAVM
jgi:hypothetical protein